MFPRMSDRSLPSHSVALAFAAGALIALASGCAAEKREPAIATMTPVTTNEAAPSADDARSVAPSSDASAASDGPQDASSAPAARAALVSPDEFPKLRVHRGPYPASVTVEGQRLGAGNQRLVPEFEIPELTAEEKKKLGLDKQKRYDPLAFYKGRKMGNNVSRDLGGGAIAISRVDTAGADSYGRGERKIAAAGVMTPTPLIGYGDPRIITTGRGDARTLGGNRGHFDGGVKPGYDVDPRRYWHERQQAD